MEIKCVLNKTTERKETILVLSLRRKESCLVNLEGAKPKFAPSL